MSGNKLTFKIGTIKFICNSKNLKQKLHLLIVNKICHSNIKTFTYF